MSKQEFMEELEGLLSDISSEEREEALNFYNGYFEDAGEGREDEVIAELGSPKQVADIIKTDLSLSAADPQRLGYFTEQGYQDTVTGKEKFELLSQVKITENKESSQETNTDTANHPSGAGGHTQGQEKQQDTRKRSRNIGLIILLCILAVPVGVPLLAAVFGIAVGIIAVLLGIIIATGAAGIALICAGVMLLAEGLIQMSVPLVGLAVCGTGLVALGLGMLLSLACGALCTKALPALIRGIVNLCRKPFQNRSVMA